MIVAGIGMLLVVSLVLLGVSKRVGCIVTMTDPEHVQIVRADSIVLHLDLVCIYIDRENFWGLVEFVNYSRKLQRKTIC